MSEIPTGDWSWIHNAAERFEQAWKKGPRPRIEDFLATVDESLWPSLLEELLRVECELLRRGGEEPNEAVYRLRFLGHESVISSVFASSPLPPGPGGQAERPAETLARSVSAPAIRSALPEELANHPDYEVIRELDHGGMGVVYLARNHLMERDEVLKVMGPKIVDQPGVMDRFLREIRAVAKLRHPNIVSAYTAFRCGKSLIFAMEYVVGLDLRRMVKARGPVPVSHACSYVHQAALGLQHAHEEGMVHRDIKPGNLMLSHKKEHAVIKLLDFGLSKAASEQSASEIGISLPVDERNLGAHLTCTGEMLGTPDFIAPEQIDDSQNADIRADIYSLGCTLHYLITGRPPYPGMTLREVLRAHRTLEAARLDELRSEVPPELAAAVAKMMAKNPDDRFQEPTDVADALAPFFKRRTPPVKSAATGDGKAAADDADGIPAGLNPNASAPAIANAPEGSQGNVGGVKRADQVDGGGPIAAGTARDRRRTLRPVAAGVVALGALSVATAFLLSRWRPVPKNSPTTTIARLGSPSDAKAIGGFGPATEPQDVGSPSNRANQEKVDASPELARLEASQASAGPSARTKKSPQPADSTSRSVKEATASKSGAQGSTSSRASALSAAAADHNRDIAQKTVQSPGALTQDGKIATPDTTVAADDPQFHKIREFELPEDVIQVRLVRTGRQALIETGGKERSLWLADYSDAKLQPTRYSKGTPPWIDLALAGDGRLAVVACADHSLWRWNLQTGKAQMIQKEATPLTAMALSPDSSHVAYVCGGAVQYCDPATGSKDDFANRRLRQKERRDNTIESIMLCTGDRAVTIHGGRGVRIWDLRRGEPGPVKWVPEGEKILDVFPDGHRVVTGGLNALLTTLYLGTGESYVIHSVKDIRAAAISRNDLALFAGANSLFYQNLKTGDRFGPVMGIGFTSHIAISEDGTLAAVTSGKSVSLLELPHLPVMYRRRPPRPAITRSPSSGDEVEDAIRNAAGFLKSSQRADGSWGDIEYEAQTGITSLATLALLAAGEKPDSRSLRASLEYLRGLGPVQLRRKILAISLQTMAFSAAEPERDQLRIAANVRWLEQAQNKPENSDPWRGSWSENESGQGQPRDNLTTQYALMALNAASEAGVPVKPEVWARARDYWLRSQKLDGSWADNLNATNSTAEMSCAGISSLIIAGLRRYQGQEFLQGDSILNCGKGGVNRNIQRAIDWLANRFQVGQNFGAGQQWRFYYLYGLERAGRLAGIRFFGPHDWYRLGAEQLVHEQNRFSGFWRGALVEDSPVLATSFALLFLAKGRAPVLINKLRHGPTTDWQNDPDDVRNLVSVVSRDWKNLLTWQVVDPATATVADLLQAPIIFFNGHRAPEFSAIAKENIREFIEQGGFIFADACCSIAEFDAGFKALMKDIFPEEQFKLRPLSEDHPVWRAKHLLSPRACDLWGIERGCRSVVIYSRRDLSCYWNSLESAPANPAVINAVKIAQNVVDYATGREMPSRKRMKSDWPAMISDGSKRQGSAPRIGRLKHAGDWNVASRAMRNLMDALGKQGLVVGEESSPEDLNPQDPGLVHCRLIYLNGRVAFSFNKEDLDALRGRLAPNGGTLFADAAGASPAFDADFRRFVGELLPKNPLVPIPRNDDLFTAKVGVDLSQVQYTKVAGGARDYPQLEGVKINDHWAVIYSKYDIGCALDHSAGIDCKGYTYESAVAIAGNVVQYAGLP
jgi:serine/threonine protein kinase